MTDTATCTCNLSVCLRYMYSVGSINYMHIYVYTFRCQILPESPLGSNVFLLVYSKTGSFTYHYSIGVDHSNQCNAKQNTDKFERVLRKLEVRRFGKENGSYQIAFRRGEA